MREVVPITVHTSQPALGLRFAGTISLTHCPSTPGTRGPVHRRGARGLRRRVPAALRVCQVCQACQACQTCQRDWHPCLVTSPDSACNRLQPPALPSGLIYACLIPTERNPIITPTSQPEAEMPSVTVDPVGAHGP